MKCSTIRLPGGEAAIICTSGKRRARCRCGNVSTLLCDWKVKADPHTKLTCDAALCDACATEVGPGKHLCPEHNAIWQARLGAIAAKSGP